MNKEGPSCWETLSRTILSSANQGHERRKRHTLKDSPPKRPKQKEDVTFALNACSWQSGHINEEMTHEQYHLICCNSQQVEEGDGWDRHLSSNLHDQQMDGQNQWKGDI